MWTRQIETRRSSGKKIVMALAAATLAFSTLAYAVAGSLAAVVVESTPPGARVIVGGQVIGQTPTTLKLPAGVKVRIKVEKKGFKARSFSVTPAEGKAKRVRIKLKPN